MAKHLVSCVECGRQFDANKGGWYDRNSRRYTCKPCMKRLKKEARGGVPSGGYLAWGIVLCFLFPPVGIGMVIYYCVKKKGAA